MSFSYLFTKSRHTWHRINKFITKSTFSVYSQIKWRDNRHRRVSRKQQTGKPVPPKCPNKLHFRDDFSPPRNNILFLGNFELNEGRKGKKGRRKAVTICKAHLLSQRAAKVINSHYLSILSTDAKIYNLQRNW